MMAKGTINLLIEQFRSKLSNLYNSNECNAILDLVFEDIFGKNRFWLQQDELLNPDRKQIEQFNLYLTKLSQGIPVQYVLGYSWFLDRKLKVNQYTLIPRQETEELVLWILSNEEKPSRVLDIGTGSGCIAVSLAAALSDSTLISCDISHQCIEIARTNATDYGLQNLEFVLCDILQPSFSPDYTFDVIVSNPPYVRESEKVKMSENVLNHEPHTALFVKDTDPLIFYEAILDFASKYLQSKGSVYFEINESLSKETSEMCILKGFTQVEVRNDIHEKPRMIRAKR